MKNLFLAALLGLVSLSASALPVPVNYPQRFFVGEEVQAFLNDSLKKHCTGITDYADHVELIGMEPVFIEEDGVQVDMLVKFTFEVDYNTNDDINDEIAISVKAFHVDALSKPTKKVVGVWSTGRVCTDF